MQWDSIALRSFITKKEHHWAKWNMRCRFLFFVKMCHLVNVHVNYSTLQNSKKSQLWFCMNFYSSWTLLDTCFLLVSYSIAEEKCSSTFSHHVFSVNRLQTLLVEIFFDNSRAKFVKWLHEHTNFWFWYFPVQPSPLHCPGKNGKTKRSVSKQIF